MNTPPLRWSADTASAAHAPVELSYEANAAELAAHKRYAGVEDVTELHRAGEDFPLSGGRYRASGTLKASVVQASVVNLEPVPSSIQESFSVEYWPPEAIGEAQEDTPFDAELPEPLDGGRIPVGTLLSRDFRACARPLSPQSGRQVRLDSASRRGGAEPLRKARPPETGRSAGREVGMAVQSCAAPQYFDCQPRLIQYVLPLGSWLSPYVAARGLDFYKMGSPVTIALDAMGGDFGPSVVIPAAALSLIRHPDTHYIFFGREVRNPRVSVRAFAARRRQPDRAHRRCRIHE